MVTSSEARSLPRPTPTSRKGGDELMWSARVCAPETLEYLSVPAPRGEQLKPGEVIVRPIVGGICGSDLPFFTTGVTLDGEPMDGGTPLHEIVGEVVAAADDAHEIGRTVVGWARDNNGLAELVVTGGNDVMPVAEIPPRDAIVAQPLACVLAAVDRLAVSVVGELVAVLGGGPIGLLFAEVLAARGARRVTVVDPVRRLPDLAVFGVDEHVPATAQQWAVDLRDVDRPAVVVEAVGHEAPVVAAAVGAAAEWGHVYCFGLPDSEPYPIDMMSLLRKHLTVYSGTTGRDRPRYLAAAIEYVNRRADLARTLVTDVFAASDAQDAFACAAGRTADHGKVLVDMTTT